MAEGQELIFQYAGLQYWRHVAIRVLTSVGWDPSCVYEDTLCPCSFGGNTVRWEKIITGADNKCQGVGALETIEACF